MRKSRAVNKEREGNVHFMGRGKTGKWVADVDTSGKLGKSGLSRIRIVALETGNGVFGEWVIKWRRALWPESTYSLS